MFSVFGKPWYVRLLLFSMFFACCFLALFFLCQYQSRPVMIDQWVMDLINNIRISLIENISRFFSLIGGGLIVLWALVIAALLFFGLKKRELTVYFAAANFLVLVLTTVFKFFGHRARPLDDISFDPQYSFSDYITSAQYNSFSFPSGHTSASVVFFGLLFWLAPVLSKNKWWQAVIRVFSTVAILWVPFSRVHLQLHYPTDVMGGFCLGAAVLMGVIFAYRIFAKGETLNA